MSMVFDGSCERMIPGRCLTELSPSLTLTLAGATGNITGRWEHPKIVNLCKNGSSYTGGGIYPAAKEVSIGRRACAPASTARTKGEIWRQSSSPPVEHPPPHTQHTNTQAFSLSRRRRKRCERLELKPEERGESFSVSSMRMTLAAWVYILKLWDKQGPTLSQCCSTHSPRSQRMWWVQGLPRPAQAEPDSPPLAREARGQAANHPAREARGQAANHPAQEAG